MSYEFREYLPGDEAALVALFNLVFRGDPRGRPPRTVAEWRWQFLANPGGWRIWLALHEGEIVAQSAGLGYRARCNGSEVAFSQSVDSLVHPAHRAGLKHPGLFVRTVLPYIAAYGGRRDLMFFGWPNRAALRIGQNHLGYELVRRTVLQARTPGEGPRALPPGVRRSTKLDLPVHGLWDRFSRRCAAAVIRDEAFLDWRFAQCPSQSYEFLTVESAARGLEGLCVVGFVNWPIPSTLAIAEWLVPEDESEVGGLLLDGVLARARDQRAEVVIGLFPPWSTWAARFERAGFEEHDAELLLVSRSHDACYGVHWLRDNWWYQLAESDFV